MTDIERAKALIAKLIRTEGGPYLDEHRAKDAATLAAALTAVRREQIEIDAGIAETMAGEERRWTSMSPSARRDAEVLAGAAFCIRAQSAAALRAQLEEKG
jgi:hypothetical protein